MTPKQKRMRDRIVVALVLFAAVYAFTELAPLSTWLGSERAAVYVEFALFLIPYLVAGYDVLVRAAKNIGSGHFLDENFLMTVATVGAFAMVAFPDSDPHMAEGAAVMLFYQVGEFFQGYAVGKSRASITEMMDIAPDYANVMRDGELAQVDPYDVPVGSRIVVKPGERVPLDGVVVEGASQIDTAALTGESVPRTAGPGDEVVSGCVSMTGLLTVETTKPFEESTVSRILELVENASDKKAKTENFITRFARVYTPAVVGVAAVLAVVPPLLGWGAFGDWVFRGLTFLVVSCPCALVISVPLSFFGGIGGASRAGVLVKGSNYLEALAQVDTVVFDKTGTLTKGNFTVVATSPAEGCDGRDVLELAAHAEAFSDHPIALSVRAAFEEAGGQIDRARLSEVEELSGHGIEATLDGQGLLVGNDMLMGMHGVAFDPSDAVGTILYVALGGAFKGSIVIADEPKEGAAEAVAELHGAGIARAVMVTGDREPVAAAVAAQLGLDEYHAEQLPQQKVEQVERLMTAQENAAGKRKGKLAFVGDGINDAPVLMRADVGIAMGAMGSDAAIEAADVVLMDDKLASIARAIRISHKTMRIVWQNIVFALGVKFVVLVLAALGIANMWLAVFADVGVAMLAILNAMRCMNVKRL